MSISQFSDDNDENMLIHLWIRHWVNSNLCLDRVSSLKKHIMKLVVATLVLMTLFSFASLDHGLLVSLTVSSLSEQFSLAATLLELSSGGVRFKS